MDLSAPTTNSFMVLFGSDMIYALIKAQVISLFRDKMAMALSFALPCIMFTVFAVIFGGTTKSDPKPMKVLVADFDGSKSASRMIQSLRSMNRIEVTTIFEYLKSQTTSVGQQSEAVNAAEMNRQKAITAVQSGKADAAVIFPQGLEASLASFGQSDRPSIELIFDTSNPMAEQMLVGVLQASAFTSSPDVLMEKGLEQFRTLGGPFSPLQDAAVQTMKSLLAADNTPDGKLPSDSANASDNKTGKEAESPENADSVGALSMADGIVRIKSVSARELNQDSGKPKQQTDGDKMISYYAAGISVMFIMFSMSGASSSLLEHQERGTLERLLSGKMTMFHLLTSHWLFYVGLGFVQISLMFVFASLVFGLELWNTQTLLGASLMALVSAMASAAFIMMIATLCRSRKQLEGFSSIVILIMSAIGGSMMPRFIMPSFLLRFSSVTFNAWSMDGFLKVFWYRTPETSVVISILPEMSIILLMTAVFLLIARVGARRWVER